MGSPGVLLVDDGEERVQTVAAFERAGFSVVTAADADEGLSALDTRTVDCVISEHDLPDANGIAFLRAVREQAPDVPFVLYTDDGDETLASEAIGAGVTDYLPKSRRPSVLVRRVADAIAGVDADDLGFEDDGATAEDTLLDDEGTAGGTPDGEGTADADRSAAGTVDGLRSDAHRSRIDGGTLARRARLSSTLKERAMDAAPVGITISDPGLEDNPLIYINDAYEEVTGYDETEVIGRNCRFLQGEQSDPDAIARMREAIEADESVSVELINYRKDGTEFWNKVDIAPITDETGTVTHYVGFQTDITDRVRAEQRAERRAEELAAERENLEHLLDRINGLVGDVAGVLVEATTREEIASRVCGLLVDTVAYDVAWIGKPDIAAEAITPEAFAGRGTDPASLELPVDTDDPAGPTAAAMETQELQVVPDLSALTAEGWHGDVVEACGTMAAIPIATQDSLYGVLHVYATDSSVFNERETTVLAALGRMIANAISALETKRILTADNVISLSFDIADRSLFFVDVAKEADCRLTHAGSVYQSDGSLLLIFGVEDGDPEQVRELAAGHDDVTGATVITNDGGTGGLIEVHIESSPLLSLLAEYGAETRGIEAENGLGKLEVELPHEANARSLVEALEETFDGVELTAYHEHERPAKTKQEFIASLEEKLTDRQLTALQKAYVSEFFEWPRPTSGDELAESMGIARSTFHQHLRAAERKLVGEFFER